MIKAACAGAVCSAGILLSGPICGEMVMASPSTPDATSGVALSITSSVVGGAVGGWMFAPSRVALSLSRPLLPGIVIVRREMVFVVVCVAASGVALLGSVRLNSDRRRAIDFDEFALDIMDTTDLGVEGSSLSSPDSRGALLSREPGDIPPDHVNC